MMDDEQLKENADMINIQQTMILNDNDNVDKAQPINNNNNNNEPSAPIQKENVYKAIEKQQQPEPSPFEQLKNMYAKDEKKQKIKLKLRVGTTVDIYSSSRQDWMEGIIKEIKGDLLCIVYGKHMKWLKKNSRQLRPKPEKIRRAIQNQSTFKPAPPSEPPPAFPIERNNNGYKLNDENNNEDPQIDNEMEAFLQKLKAQCDAMKPSETDWICDVCTFVNAEDDTVCQMCLHEKSSDNKSNVCYIYCLSTKNNFKIHKYILETKVFSSKTNMGMSIMSI